MLIVSLLGSLLMFFQNCAPPMKAAKDDIGGVQLADSGSEYRKTSGSAYRTLTLFDNERTIEIDLVSGHADTFIGSNRQSVEYCFSDSDLSAARALMAKAEVCEPLQPYRDQAVCTQIYSYPYAALGEGAQRISLGEQFNGCHIPNDLCGADGKALRAQAAALLAVSSQRSCN